MSEKINLAGLREYLAEKQRYEDPCVLSIEELAALVETVEAAAFVAPRARHHEDCQPLGATGCQCGLWGLGQALSRFDFGDA